MLSEVSAVRSLPFTVLDKLIEAEDSLTSLRQHLAKVLCGSF